MLKLFSGRSNPTFAANMALHLQTNYSQDYKGALDIQNFSDGEIFPSFPESVRGNIVAILQSTHSKYSGANNILELLLAVDAAKRSSAQKIFCVMPYFGYARQDRRDKPGVPISAKLIANLLTKAGADRIITLDLHSPQIQGFFDIPCDVLYASYIMLPFLRKQSFPNLTIWAPDKGAEKMARFWAKKLGAIVKKSHQNDPVEEKNFFVTAEKRRPKPDVVEIVKVDGDENGSNPLINGRTVLIVDDVASTFGTIKASVNAAYDRGASAVYGCCIHPLLDGPAPDILGNSKIVKLYTTNTIPLDTKQTKMMQKIEEVDVSGLLAEATIRAANNQSISALYEDREELVR